MAVYDLAIKHFSDNFDLRIISAGNYPEIQARGEFVRTTWFLVVLQLTTLAG